MSTIAAGVFLAGAGGVLLARAAPAFLRGLRSRHRPTLPATIERAEYRIGHVRGGGRSPGGGLARDWTVLYRYVVPDRFAAQGWPQEGTRLRYGPVAPGEARRRLASLAAGEVVQVAVNPRNRADSVLVPGLSWWGVLATAVPVAMIVAGLVWMTT